MTMPPADNLPEDLVGDAPPMTQDVIPLARPLTPADPMLLPAISAGRALVHVLVFLALVLTPAVLISAITDVGETPATEEVAFNTNLVISGTVGLGVVLVSVILLILRLARIRVAAIGLTARSWRTDMLLGPPVTLLTFLGFMMCAGFFYLFWPEGLRQLQANPERIDDIIPQMGLAPLTVLMVVIATYEEIIFRGFLLTHLRRLSGSWTIATLLAGFLFVLPHLGDSPGTQTWATAFPLMIMAIIWSAITVWRRSLVPTIVAHTLFNLTQIVLMRWG